MSQIGVIFWVKETKRQRFRSADQSKCDELYQLN